MAGKRKTNTIVGPIKNDESSLIHTDQEKADAFNSYFSNVGENLARDLRSNAAPDVRYISRITPTIIQMSSVQARLEKEIQKVKTGKAKGADKITVKEIKASQGEHSQILSVCNTSLKQNKFPTKYEIAKLQMTF